MERFVNKTGAIEAWKESVLPGALLKLEEFRAAIHAEILYWSDVKHSYDYLLENRTYSEMELCGTLAYIDPPEGFEYEIGFVKTSEDAEMVGHAYYKKGNKIFCLTPGQFVPEEDAVEKGPGGRVKAFEQKAPELFRHLGGGITALYGDREEIKERLGLEYIDFSFE